MIEFILGLIIGGLVGAKIVLNKVNASFRKSPYSKVIPFGYFEGDNYLLH